MFIYSGFYNEVFRQGLWAFLWEKNTLSTNYYSQQTRYCKSSWGGSVNEIILVCEGCSVLGITRLQPCSETLPLPLCLSVSRIRCMSIYEPSPLRVLCVWRSSLRRPRLHIIYATAVISQQPTVHFTHPFKVHFTLLCRSPCCVLPLQGGREMGGRRERESDGWRNEGTDNGGTKTNQ